VYPNGEVYVPGAVAGLDVVVSDCAPTSALVQRTD
jgi:hypothetical protein